MSKHGDGAIEACSDGILTNVLFDYTQKEDIEKTCERGKMKERYTNTMDAETLKEFNDACRNVGMKRSNVVEKLAQQFIRRSKKAENILFGGDDDLL